MSKKVAVVTGSNKGIGFAIVRSLCSKFDGDVYLTARSERRGLSAVQELEKEGLHPKFRLLDIDDEDSIQSLASFLKDQYGGLDVLVNNAAIAYSFQMEDIPSAKQYENTIRINFFDNLTVCKHLFPLLRPHARVVNLSSSTSVLSQYSSSEELQKRFKTQSHTEESLCKLMQQFVEDAKAGVIDWGLREKDGYSISKIAVNALTCIQQREFLEDSRPDLVVNAVHPGFTDTDLTGHKGHLTLDQGAEAPVYCALLPPNIESPKGEFIWCDKSIRSWR